MYKIWAPYYKTEYRPPGTPHPQRSPGLSLLLVCPAKLWRLQNVFPPVPVSHADVAIHASLSNAMQALQWFLLTTTAGQSDVYNALEK